MQYSILIEAVTDLDFPKGYYYAYIPSLGIVTHGQGVDGAKNAAHELISLWIAEKKARGEVVACEADSYFARIEIEDALVST